MTLTMNQHFFLGTFLATEYTDYSKPNGSQAYLDKVHSFFGLSDDKAPHNIQPDQWDQFASIALDDFLDMPPASFNYLMDEELEQLKTLIDFDNKYGFAVCREVASFYKSLYAASC